MIVYKQKIFHLYHATYNAHLPSIMKNGLGGVPYRNWEMSTGAVCLSTSAYDAQEFAQMAGHHDYTYALDVPKKIVDSGIVVLRVNVSSLPLRWDKNIDKNRPVCLAYDGVIKPKRLTAITQLEMWEHLPVADFFSYEEIG